jgi:sugar lactone lactonase YvrE
VTPAGVVTTIAGGAQGYLDGQGTAAQFNFPTGLALDGQGNLFVADYNNQRIRRISAAGIVTTVAGTGGQGYADGPANAALFTFPHRLALDAAGNLYVADVSNQRIRKISVAGQVSTLAGGTAGSADGRGTAAQFNLPFAVATDAAGRLYVADLGNNRIRKIQ